METALNHLLALSDPNWFFYMQYINGIPVLRENFSDYRERLKDTKDDFIKLFTEFMPSVKTGMPDLPPDKGPELKDIEIEFGVDKAIVKTEHSHEAG